MENATYTEQLQQVPASPYDVCPLLTGMLMPQITVTGQDGNPLDLTAAVHAKPSVLVFYRGGW